MRSKASGPGGRRRPLSGRGFTYLGVMFVTVILTLTAAMASALWSTAQRGEDERQLVFAGRQFQAAIERYHRVQASSPSPYPQRLEDLLGRQPASPSTRTLRRIYDDPITRGRDWGLVRLPDGGIVGVFSTSDRLTLRGEEASAGRATGAPRTYRDWRFVATGATRFLQAASAPATPASAPTPEGKSVPDARQAPVAATAPSMESDPASEAAVVVQPTRDDYRTRSPEACSRIAAFDEKTCAGLDTRGDADGAAGCRESAIQRGIVCALQKDGAFPSLATRP